MQGGVRCWLALHKELQYLLESVGKLQQPMDFHRLRFICILKAAERTFFPVEEAVARLSLMLGKDEEGL